MEIGTDGSISPESAVTEAASILMDHLDLFIFVPDYETPQDSAGASGLVSASPLMNENLLKHIDELELSVRACNCLRNANIKTIADLVQKTEHEMLRTKNFGRKSLNEIKEILNSMGLSFGMRIDADSLEIPALSQRGGMGKNAS
jgi:DNA-directed RNA polymerase subunit alpha